MSESFLDGKVELLCGDCCALLDDAYDANRDFAGSLNDAYAAIRSRKAAGGPGWKPRQWVKTANTEEEERNGNGQAYTR